MLTRLFHTVVCNYTIDVLSYTVRRTQYDRLSQQQLSLLFCVSATALTIIISLAVFIGLLMLIVGMFILKR